MPYALLDREAPYTEWQHACVAVNKVNLTIEDAEEGFDLIRHGEIDEAMLAAYMSRFQDVTPELVIASLRSRFDLLSEAEESGIDIKREQPEVYRSMLTGPLTPEDFYVFGDIEA